jgi:hypothetical protein
MKIKVDGKMIEIESGPKFHVLYKGELHGPFISNDEAFMSMGVRHKPKDVRYKESDLDEWAMKVNKIRHGNIVQ